MIAAITRTALYTRTSNDAGIGGFAEPVERDMMAYTVALETVIRLCMVKGIGAGVEESRPDTRSIKRAACSVAASKPVCLAINRICQLAIATVHQRHRIG